MQMIKSKSIKINAALSVIKQLCSVVFPLITIPYISRVLQVEAYGKVNFGNSVVSYFVLLAGLGVSTYAIRDGARIRDDKKEITEFASQVYTINIISTAIAYVILFCCIIFSTKLHSYTALILVQSCTIILTTMGADWINSIYEDYFYITVRYLIFQVMALVLMFLFVHSPGDYIKYAAISVLATAGGNIVNFFYRKKYIKLHIVSAQSCKKHISAVLILFFYAIATTIYVNSDTTILGFLKNEQAVGIYSLSTKIYSVVKQILNAVIIVSLPRLSAYLGEKKVDEYKKLSNKIRDVLFTLVFPAIVGLFCLSSQIISIVGGSQYVAGAKALRILCVSLGFAVMSGFYCCAVLLPYKKDKICLYVSVVCAIVNIVLNFFFIPKLSYVGAAITTLIAEALNYFLFVYYSYKSVDLPKERKCIGIAILGSLLIALVCVVLKRSITNVYYCVGLSILVSIVAYFSLQFIMGNYLIVGAVKAMVCKMRKPHK